MRGSSGGGAGGGGVQKAFGLVPVEPAFWHATFLEINTAVFPFSPQHTSATQQSPAPLALIFYHKTCVQSKHMVSQSKMHVLSVFI